MNSEFQDWVMVFVTILERTLNLNWLPRSFGEHFDTWNTLIFVIVAPSWKVKSTIIIINVIYLGFRYPENYINYLLIVQAILLSFLLAAFFYFSEKQEKNVFLNQFAVFEKEAMWTEMLHMIP